MLSDLLNRLEARVGRHRGVRNLMTIIVIGTVFVYLADYILPLTGSGTTMAGLLSFNKNRILAGQVWRLLTFVFVPTGSGSLILFAVSLYFYWLMGEYLQNHWGTFRFTIFYTVGMLGAVISGCITGYATAYYLNMSLMLAMACIYPDMEMNLYGFIKLRLKWLALLSVAMMVLPLLRSHGWQQPVALIAALLNVILFFSDRMIGQLRQFRRHQQWKRSWRSGWKR